MLGAGYHTVSVNCSTGMLFAGLQILPVNVLHQYIRFMLSDCTGKCAENIGYIQVIRHYR